MSKVLKVIGGFVLAGVLVLLPMSSGLAAAEPGGSSAVVETHAMSETGSAVAPAAGWFHTTYWVRLNEDPLFWSNQMGWWHGWGYAYCHVSASDGTGLWTYVYSDYDDSYGWARNATFNNGAALTGVGYC